ncbi:RHS repeat-associated core domain-containing protein [Pseudomonas typographi]|uniref:RHS repeat-associated core domain-containing protein n=1 Tax=Pseudomonas typographi TaxID=2715964 RepID=UPI00168720D6|nr:RHS repeat-associated core domain-containing protein [Pseudomonas typographi]MBD1589443.1 RHS repeat-associated core domain-containing protein [Pseudomonas typographi]
MYRLVCADRSNTPLGSISPSFSALSVAPYGYYGEGNAGGPACVFNGQLLESSINGYLPGNGYRLYTPALMRFARPDHWAPFSRGGINAYAYCAAEPINASDPSGRFWILTPGRLFRFKLAPKIKGSVEANAFEQVYASFENVNWRQQLVTRKARSAKALDNYIKLDAQKQELLTEVGVFGANRQRMFEQQSFEWRQVEARRESASALRKKRLKQRAAPRGLPTLEDANERWQRRRLFMHLPGADSFD